MKKLSIFLLGLFICNLSFAQINQYQNSSPAEVKAFWEKTLVGGFSQPRPCAL